MGINKKNNICQNIWDTIKEIMWLILLSDWNIIVENNGFFHGRGLGHGLDL